MNKNSPLIIALDVESLKSAQKLVTELKDSVDFYKVGLRLFTQEGPKIVHWLKNKQKRIFLDLKFFDIPNTVAQAVESATLLGVDLLTLHASGGLEMMQAAVQSARRTAKKSQLPRPEIFAVTVLTSFSDLNSVGVEHSIENQVLKLAQLACQAKVDGIVCSPHEIEIIRKHFGKKLKILTPGIRLSGEQAPHTPDDQKRVMSPEQAIEKGANYLVVGRPVLQATQPKNVVLQILDSFSKRGKKQATPQALKKSRP